MSSCTAETNRVEVTTIEGGEAGLSSDPEQTVVSLYDRVHYVVSKACFHREISADILAGKRSRALCVAMCRVKREDGSQQQGCAPEGDT